MAPLKREMVIGPDTSVEEALKRMSQAKLGRLFVMRGGKFLGMITQSGLLRFLEIKRTLEIPEAMPVHRRIPASLV
jgi:CBS domain-containing protein